MSLFLSYADCAFGGRLLMVYGMLIKFSKTALMLLLLLILRSTQAMFASFLSVLLMAKKIEHVKDIIMVGFPLGIFHLSTRRPLMERRQRGDRLVCLYVLTL
jgi:hypothetical protein